MPRLSLWLRLALAALPLLSSVHVHALRTWTLVATAGGQASDWSAPSAWSAPCNTSSTLPGSAAGDAVVLPASANAFNSTLSIALAHSLASVSVLCARSLCFSRSRCP
jgi:hypothetical protein